MKTTVAGFDYLNLFSAPAAADEVIARLAADGRPDLAWDMARQALEYALGRVQHAESFDGRGGGPAGGPGPDLASDAVSHLEFKHLEFVEITPDLRPDQVRRLAMADRRDPTIAVAEAEDRESWPMPRPLRSDPLAERTP